MRFFVWTVIDFNDSSGGCDLSHQVLDMTTGETVAICNSTHWATAICEALNR